MHRSVRRFLAGLAACCVLSCASPAFAQLTTQTIVSGIPGIVGFVQDPVVPDTFYLVRLQGRIDVLQHGQVLDTPFLDLTGVVSLGVERGLLSMAFSPRLESNRVFVSFTDVDGHSVVARFERSGNPVVADPASRLDLEWAPGQRVIHQPGPSHNGGHLAFGGDGYLYLGLGDGREGIDPLNNAQNPNTLLGKMLRIDVDVPSGDTKGYRVPADNPFVGYPVLPEIWDFGFRNPWRYSFDNPALGGTGALIIGDVGEGTREEVDYEPAGRGGRNYGWRVREGTIPTPNLPPQTPLYQPLTEPLFEYARDVGRAVTGGYVYRGSQLPASFRGRYFVADFISSAIGSIGLKIDPATHEARVADVIEHTVELGGKAVLGRIVSFAEDLSGELYVIRYDGAGAVYKIVANTTKPGPPLASGVVSGNRVTLSWGPSPGVPPEQYRVEVGATAGASDILVLEQPAASTGLVASDVPNGTYFVRVYARNAAGISVPAPELRLVVGCGAPAPPTGLVHAVSGGLVALAWVGVTDATGYLVEAGSTSGGADIGVLPVTPLLSGLVVAAPQGTYYVRVRAQTACGISTPSNEVTIVVQQ